MTKSRHIDMRLSPRRHTQLRTTLVHNDNVIQNCTAHNISFSGAYVEIPFASSAARIGDRVKLVIDSDGRELLVLQGVISRHTDNGSGISLTNVSHHNNAILLGLIFGRQQANDPVRPATQHPVGWH